MKFSKNYLPKVNFKKSFVWIITFFLALIFFMVSAPHPAKGVVRDSAAYLYLSQPPEPDSSSPEGFLPALASGLTDQILGFPEEKTSEEGANLLIRRGGAMGVIADMTGYVYRQPSSSAIIWAQDQYRQIIGLNSLYVQAAAPTTSPIPLSNESSNYFQGTGYEILQPVNAFWQWSRNLVYGFFIIVMIIIAFLILFRQNLGGQQVVTLANSLPSILFSLALVTLSYPICGFFVDLVFIGSNFVQSVIITAPGAPGNDPVFLTNSLKLKDGTTDKASPALNALQPDDPQTSIWNVWNTASVNICGNDPAVTSECNLASILPNSASDPVVKTGIAIAQVVLNLIGDNPLINLILSIILLQATLKLLFVLLRSYFTLGFYPILAPWIFLSAAIPNRTGNAIQSLIRTLGGAALNFIAIYAALLFIIIIGHSGELTGAFNDSGNFQWTPPLLGYTEDQLSGDKNIMRPLAAYLLFMALPSIPELISQFLQLPSGNVVGSTISQGTQAGLKTATGFIKGALGFGKEKFFGGNG